MFFLIRAENLIPLLNERAGYPPDTKLLVYEEIKAHTVQEITNFNEPLERVSIFCICFHRQIGFVIYLFESDPVFSKFSTENSLYIYFGQIFKQIENWDYCPQQFFEFEKYLGFVFPGCHLKNSRREMICL